MYRCPLRPPIRHNTGLPLGVAAVSVINQYYRRGSLPVGGYSGHVGNPNHTPGPEFTNHGEGWYVEKLAADFPHGSFGSASAVQVLTSALRTAEDGSVTIASVGHATNLVDLLASPGGAEVRRICARLVASTSITVTAGPHPTLLACS